MEGRQTAVEQEDMKESSGSLAIHLSLPVSLRCPHTGEIRTHTFDLVKDIATSSLFLNS